VLGLDPGLSRFGYAVLAPAARGAATAVALGVLTTEPGRPVPERLAELQRDLRALFDEHPPRVVVVERVLFQVNVRTAMAVGQASGVAMAEAAGRGCAVAQYSPNEVKQAVTGYGAAPKAQVQRMVQTLLGLQRVPSPPDAADAAALALCHLAVEPVQRAAARASGGAHPASGVEVTA